MWTRDVAGARRPARPRVSRSRPPFSSFSAWVSSSTSPAAKARKNGESMRQLCVQTVCVCKGKGKVQDQAKVKATKTLAKAR